MKKVCGGDDRIGLSRGLIYFLRDNGSILDYREGKWVNESLIFNTYNT